MRLETPRTIIRDYVIDDFKDVHLYAQKLDLCKFQVWGPNSEEDTMAFIEEAIAFAGVETTRTRYEMAIEDKASGHVIGGVGLYLKSNNNLVAEIGYSIAPWKWRQGYGIEAAKAMTEYGLDVLNLHRLEGTCDVRNIGSAKILEGCGLVREGHIRSHILLRDGWRDSYLYGYVKD